LYGLPTDFDRLFEVDVYRDTARQGMGWMNTYRVKKRYEIQATIAIKIFGRLKKTVFFLEL